MKPTKDFPTLDVLTAITGRMVINDIGGVYRALNWMTGENLFTHQLPRVCREARPVIVALHPELAAAVSESDQVKPENWQAFAALWLNRYGPTIAVPQFTTDEHERIDAMSELAEKVHPDKIVVVRP